MSWAEEAHTACAQAGRRNGPALKAVIAVLADTQGGLNAHQIAAQAHTPRGPVSNASVYRILADLTQLSVLRSIDLGTGAARYELLRADGHHQHHLVCDDCGRTNRFAAPDLEAAVHDAENRLDPQAHAHDVVLHGRCRDCR